MLLTLIRKNLVQRPLRYLLTGLAILFGVAAVSAVFIFTDGLRVTFDGLAGNIESGYDLKVRSDVPFGDGLAVPPVPVEFVQDFAAIEGVTNVQPWIADFGVLVVDADREPLIANGPNIGLNWEADTTTPRQYLLDGRPPTEPDEFALDADGFAAGNFTIGDTYGVGTPAGARQMELVGTFNFANPEVNASVGAVLVAFDQDFAFDILNDSAGYDEIVLTTNRNPDAVTAELEALIAGDDSTFIVATQEDEQERVQGAFGQILGIFQTILLVFAFIILGVSAFLIFNVFTITLGQRIKELGLLRSIGAFGSQVTNMMLGEALILGIAATIIGIPAGWALATLLRFGLGQLGFPDDTGLPINPGTILWAIGVGVLVTLMAAIVPSIRARRVTPISALREGASDADLDTEPSIVGAAVAMTAGLAICILGFVFSGWLPRLALPLVGGIVFYFGVRWLGRRQLAQIAMLVFGLVLLTIVRFGDFGLGETFGLLGAGAILTILGASVVSALFAGPVARAIGMPVPLAILVGFIGVALAAGALGLTGFMFYELGNGNSGALGLPFAILAVATLAYGLIRTAIGAFGLTGQLARENAARSPSRTATTATALMIGLTLVTAVTVIGESIKASVTDALGSSIQADWLVQGPQSGPQGLPFSTEVSDRIRELPEISSVTNYRFQFGGFVSVPGGDPGEVAEAIPTLFAALSERDADPAMLEEVEAALGSDDLRIEDAFAVNFADVLEHINPDFVTVDLDADPITSIWLEDGEASSRDLVTGDPFLVVFADGQVEELTVTGIYNDGFVFGSMVIDHSLWQAHSPAGTDAFLSLLTADGVDAEDARAALETALTDDYPALTIQDRSEFAAEAEAQINQTLAVVNVLLMLSAGIAILGIAIALALAVFERTREIGLLRAVGTERRQTRWIVRWEGVIVAAFGGLVGVVLGVGLGVLATQKMPEFLVTTTGIPVFQLIIYVIIAAITGLAAGAFPALIAGQMNVLDAISNE